MFPIKAQIENKQTKTEKQFMGFDSLTEYVWWREQASYLFISAKQITEVKLVGAVDNSFNIYARVDLKDRFEYFLIDNKKTLTSAKKLTEDFIKTVLNKKEPEKLFKSKEFDTKNGFEALIELAKDLKK